MTIALTYRFFLITVCVSWGGHVRPEIKPVEPDLDNTSEGRHVSSAMNPHRQQTNGGGVS